MISNWLKPASSESNSFVNVRGSFLDNCLINAGQSMNLLSSKIALVGIGTQANSIRSHLYKYMPVLEKHQFADLGNTRKSGISFLLPLLKELHDSQIVTLLLDADGIGPKLLFDHYAQVKSTYRAAIVDEAIRYNSAINPLEASTHDLHFLHDASYPCVQLDHLGYQMHLSSTRDAEFRQNNIRLSKLRNHRQSVEPALRNKDFLYFNMNGIRKADAPGKSGSNPSGLASEDASQITRYAGLSESLSTLMIGGFWHLESQTAELISQMLWYYMEGYSNRINDEPKKNANQLQQYIVDIEDSEVSLTFKKSETSGRWWVEVPNAIDGIEQPYLVPCSYNDYQQACNNEISETIVDIIESN